MIRFLNFLLYCLPLLCLFSCQNDIAVVNSLHFRDEIPVRTTRDAKMIYCDSGSAKAQLLAPAMDQYEGLNPRLVMPKGIDLTFYNDSLKETTHLTADSAIKEDKDNVMKAFRHVVVRNIKKDTLHTEKLIWDEKKRIIYTDVDVLIITGDGDILEGKGLESNEDFSHWKIKKPKGKTLLDKGDK
ncbi:MAG TPA: LPS export ABC transporter periplasmic protein LptC [Bacteroidia bacterium]|jgi:LPS export ABC transporter protein LptC|nr:LPS export ABC transporter periplasmic protein LptC [Bacteroidia bacterium]